MESRVQPSVEQLAERFLERVRRGEQPEISEYVARYPDLAEQIREVFSAVAFVERFAPQPGELSAAPYPAAKRLGDFRILREVGRGGMGVVYEAVQESLGRHVALKVMTPRDSGHGASVERFHREAQVAARLHHTNLVPVFDVGEHEGVLYYAMQFIHGSSLDKVLAELRRMRQAKDGVGQSSGDALSREIARDLCSDASGRAAQGVPLPTGASPAAPSRGDEARSPYDAEPLPEASTASSILAAGEAALAPTAARHPYYQSVARLGLQVAEGLAYLHGQGLLHRDIKPANLLLDTRGVVWITDLGLVHDEDAEALTRTGDVVGTLRYMGPERLKGQVYPSSDVYGLGMTLYELLTLQSAFPRGKRGDLAQQIAEVDPPRPRRIAPELPRDLETIVLKSIDKDPHRRYPRAVDLAADLRCFLDDRPIAARRATALERGWRWCRRNRALASLIGSVAALLLVLAAGSSWAAWLFRAQANDLRVERVNSTRRLYDALVAQAQASRWSRRPGQRFQGLQSLKDAARLIAPLGLGDDQRLQLRNEAIACLGLIDVRPLGRASSAPRDGKILTFDEELQRYVTSDADGVISIRRVSDDGELVRLPGPGSRGHVAEFSPSGRYLVVKYHDPGPRILKAWDLASRTSLSETPDVEAFSFSPGGDLLAAARQDGEVVLTDLPARDPRGRFASVANPTSVRFHPHEPWVALANRADNLVRVCDAQSGRVVSLLPHSQVVLDVSWHPSGRFLACACSDFRTYVWDIAAKKPLSILTGHQAEVTHVDFNHSGDLLATYAWDGTTRLWDTWSGQEQMRMPGMYRRFRSDDRRIAVAGGDSRRDLSNFDTWEIAAAAEVRTLHDAAAEGKGPTMVDLSADGNLLLSNGPDGVRLWDVARGVELARWCGDGENLEAPSGALFHRSEPSILTSARSGLRRWPLSRVDGAGTAELIVGPPETIAGLDNTSRIAQDREGKIVVIARGPHAHVIAWSDRRPLATTGTHAHMSRLAISPDGRWLATGAWHGAGAKVWDASTGRELRDLWPEAVNATVGFTPDGGHIVVGADEEYRFFATSTWELTRDIPGSLPGLMAFTDDGQMMAVLDSRHTVRLVNPTTGRTYAVLEAATPEPAAWLCFSPDGSQLAVACQTHVIRLWDLRSIRARLAAMDLDWDLPPLPDARPGAGSPRIDNVTIRAE